jgi:hypothetical protein
VSPAGWFSAAAIARLLFYLWLAAKGHAASAGMEQHLCPEERLPAW